MLLDKKKMIRLLVGWWVSVCVTIEPEAPRMPDGLWIIRVIKDRFWYLINFSTLVIMMNYPAWESEQVTKAVHKLGHGVTVNVVFHFSYFYAQHVDNRCIFYKNNRWLPLPVMCWFAFAWCRQVSGASMYLFSYCLNDKNNTNHGRYPVRLWRL